MNYVSTLQCYQRLIDHGGGEVLWKELSRSVIDLELSQAKLDFLKECRNSSLVPKSLGNDRSRLLTEINTLVRANTQDRLLLVRTSNEYGLSDTDIEEFVEAAKREGEMEISAQRSKLRGRIENLRFTHNSQKLSYTGGYKFPVL